MSPTRSYSAVEPLRSVNRKRDAGDLQSLIDIQSVRTIDVTEGLVGQKTLSSQKRPALAEQVMEFVPGDPDRRQRADICAVVEGTAQGTGPHFRRACRRMNPVEDHSQILTLAGWLTFNVYEMSRMRDRFEHDHEFGRQLQRYQRLLSGGKFDCFDGDFLENLFQPSFRQVDPGTPEYLPEIFPDRERVWIVCRNPSQAWVDRENDFDHFVEGRLIASRAECAVIGLLVHRLEGLCGVEHPHHNRGTGRSRSTQTVPAVQRVETR